MDDSEFPELSPEQALEKERAVAHARLGVAEELGWHCATLAGILAWKFADHWLAGVAVAVLYYLFITRYYGRDSKRAWAKTT